MIKEEETKQKKKKTTRFRNNRILVFGLSFGVTPPVFIPGIGV
jgi:hypothetical protein